MGKRAITVAPRDAESPSATPSTTPSPSGDQTGEQGDEAFCLVSTTGERGDCFPTRKEAEAAKDALEIEVTEQTYCVTDGPGDEAGGGGGATPTPTPSADASVSPTASSSQSPTPSPSPSPEPTVFSTLSLAANQLPCGLQAESAARAAVGDTSVRTVDTLFCVVSSAEEDLGCFIDRTAAEERQRSTGQQRLLDVIGQTARLEQRPVLAIVPPGDPAYATTPVTCATESDRERRSCSFSALESEEVVYEDEVGNRYRLAPAVIAGGDVAEANAVLGGSTGSEWAVQFQLTGEASDRFADATTAAVSAPPPQNQIAIVVDRVVISSPTVQSPITGGRGDITGGFDEAEARDLATVLNAGALPVELTRQQVQTVSPTLGSESLRQGIVAGIVGLLLLFLYLLFYYRLLGIVAWFGMSIWAVLALALISLAGTQFGYALTLAGVAGLVISLGVTADSYIVFFERLKDEVRSGKSARAAVQPAFARSYKTIIAADVVAGIAAVVLYLTAVSSVRGFALTLGVATLLDLFVVYFFKRPTVFLHRPQPAPGLAQRLRPRGGGRRRHRRHGTPGVSSLHDALETYRGHTIPHFPFVERRRVWFAFSGVLIVLSLIGLVASRLNYSIDFEGGARLQYPLAAEVTVADISEVLAESGRDGAEVQIVSGDRVAIRTESLSETGDVDELLSALAEQAGIDATEISVEDIGPTFGAEVRRQAITGLLIVLASISLYIAIRFEPKMAIGAMIALVHDVVITAGLYALVGREVTPETVIAILTILGFSLYDTVVIYDKIRENTESSVLVTRLGYVGVVDLSLNQVLMRSVNTSLVVLLPILSLLLFGGDTLKDFAFAMFVGVAIGAYSSIFLAAPLLAVLKMREKRYRQLEARRTARSRGASAPGDEPPTPATPTATAARTSDAAARSATARTGSRPRPKSKRRPPAKRKRR